MQVEGEILKPYSLYRSGFNDEIIGCSIARTDTLEEAIEIAKTHEHRNDWHFVVHHRRKKVWPTK